jgi:hypothetical protein
MIIFNWSAVTGLVEWSISEPYREPLPKIQTIQQKQIKNQATLKRTLGVASKRESRGNHKWRLSVIRKELKRRNGLQR